MVQTTTPKPPGKSSPWLKRVRVPFWTIQLLFVCVLLGAQIWAATSFSCDCFENGHAIKNTFQYQQGSSPPMYMEGEMMESGGREVTRALVPGRHEPRREGQLEVHELARFGSSSVRG